MAATTQTQYRREERHTVGQRRQVIDRPAANAGTNWNDHLDGLLSELKESLPAPASPVGDLTAPRGMPGSEDVQERCEFTSPDRSMRTVEERSRHTETVDGGTRVVSRQVVTSQSRNRTMERSAVTEPMLTWSGDDVDRGAATANSETLRINSLSASSSNLRSCSHHTPAELPVMEAPRAPSTSSSQSHRSRYEHHSSEQSLDPAVPPPVASPPGPGVLPATSPPAATTINYHIYNYGTEMPPPAASGTLERTGGWRGSLERREVSERSASSSPCNPGLYSRSVVTRVEKTTEREGQGETFPAGQRGVGRTAPFPVEKEERSEEKAERLASVHVPSHPQDGTYPDGPRRRDLGSGQVTEVRSVPVISEPSESASEPGQTPAAQSQSQSGVYYPPTGRVDCETKFHTKEKGKEGNTKTHFEASGKYKASGGSKQKDAKGGKTIPICLPCCAGAACVVM